MNLTVDLNADLGEGVGSDPELLRLVSSASIACGFHAGDANSMRDAIAAAMHFGVAVGAHPSLYDRENFGRKELPVTPEQVFDLIVYQVGGFEAIADGVGAHPNHVKPHGALYNMAVRDRELADAVVRGVIAVDSSLLLFAPGNSALAQAAAPRKLKIVPEVFADRNYLGNGSLVPPRTGPTLCSTILKKRPRGSCGCCAKARSALLTEPMLTFGRKQFAFTATRPRRWNSLAPCVPRWKTKA